MKRRKTRWPVRMKRAVPRKIIGPLDPVSGVSNVPDVTFRVCIII